jgi:hypothetical protein
VFWVYTVHKTCIMGVTGFYGLSERILALWDMAETIMPASFITCSVSERFSRYGT